MNAPSHPVIPSENFDRPLVAGNVKKAMNSAMAKSRDLWQVPLDMIRIMPEFNVRIRDEAYLAHLQTITASIKASGFWQHKPLDGYVANEGGQNVILLTGGHTRYEATLLANQDGAEIFTLPVVVSPPGTSREDLIVALVKGNEGKPLTPFEVAIVAKRLVNYGWSVSTIADRLQLSTTYVEGLLMLLGAPQEVREMVQSGQLAATTAIQSLRKHGSEVVAKLQEGLSRAQASGATRVTAKHMPGHQHQKFIRKAAPQMFTALTAVRADPAWSSLSADTRQHLESLLSTIPPAAAEEATPPTDATD